MSTKPYVHLTVYTARVCYGGADRLDVTAKSAPPEAKAFAPSWKLVSWGLKMREEASKRAARREPNAEGFAEWAWTLYRMRYTEQMRASYATRRAEWDALLRRERVVLCCYCTDSEQCHRRVLAEILAKLGALDAGELPQQHEQEDQPHASNDR